MAYAKRTKVGTTATIGQIETMLTKAGASSFQYGIKGAVAYIAFLHQRTAVKMLLRLPPQPLDGATQASIKTYEQLKKARFRSLLLLVKAKIESVESGIETFEEAFLPHIVLKNGKTVGEKLIPSIKDLNDHNGTLLLGL